MQRTFVVSLVSHYLDDILCKNYNYIFIFIKVMPETISIPFFGHSVDFIIRGYWNCANAVRKHIKNQKSVRESIARMSSKSLFRIQDDVNSYRQQLLLITSGLQRNAVAIEKLKKETAQVLFVCYNLYCSHVGYCMYILCILFSVFYH